MAKAKIIQNHFGGGRISPRSFGRTDLPQVQNGAEELINWIIMSDGSLTRRPGTVWMGYAFHKKLYARGAGSLDSFLIPFVVDEDTARVIDFRPVPGPAGDSVFRLYDDDGAVTHPTKAATRTGGSGTAHIFTLNVGNFDSDFGGQSSSDTTYIIVDSDVTSVDGVHRVTVGTVNTVAIDPGFAASPTIANLTQVFEQAIPASIFPSFDLVEPRFAQSGNVLYIASRKNHPLKFTRTNDTTWAIAEVDFDDGPWLPINATTITITPSAVTGTGITLTASAATFVAGDVGRLVRVKHGTQWGVAEIVGFTSTTIVTADVEHDFGGVTAETNWRLQDWHDSTNYPHTVVFFEGRLVWGGGDLDTQRIVSSNVDDFENMQPDDRGVGAAEVTVASHSYAYTAAAGDFSRFLWMVAHRAGLVCGTGSGIYIFSSENEEGISANTTPRTRIETTARCAAVPPAVIDSDIIFVRRGNTELARFNFDNDSQSYSSSNLSVFASDIGKRRTSNNLDPNITRIVYSQTPYNVIWGISNGDLFGLTFIGGGVAWHKHSLGGALGNTGTPGEFEFPHVVDLTVVPGPEGDDFLYLKVERFNQTEIVRLQTRLVASLSGIPEIRSYMDSSILFRGDNTSGGQEATVRDLYHLDGEAAAILHNAHEDPRQTVADGRIVLTHDIGGTSDYVVAGYPMESKVITMRLGVGSRVGTVQANRSRPIKAFLRLFETGSLKIGGETEDLDDVILRDFGDDTAPTDEETYQGIVFTGDAEISVRAAFDRLGRVTIFSDSPLPASISAVIMEVESNG